MIKSCTQGNAGGTQTDSFMAYSIDHLNEY